MRPLHFAIAALAPAAPALAGGGDPLLNEILASHTGTDTQEFIELRGTPGDSLAGVMVLVVEGQAGSAFGTLDRAWDLSAASIEPDGLYTLGDMPGVPCAQFDLGTSDSIENGAETFYLIRTTDVGGVLALLGTDVDPDGDLVTDIATNPANTILDIVALTGDLADFVYDGAPTFGPDGTFFPAGIRREPGSGPWCSEFADFDLGSDNTPCAENVDCGDIGTRVCQSLPSSTGFPALISASGSDLAGAGNMLTLTSEPVPNQPGIFFYGPNQIRVPFGNGFLCAGGGLTRILPPVVAAGMVASVTIDNSRFNPADVAYFQHWYRDPAGGGAAFNTSDAICVTFR